MNNLNDPTGPKPDDLARSYGEEGSKDVMKENMKRKGKEAVILMIVGIVTCFLLPPLGIAIMIGAIYRLNHSTAKERAQGRDKETLYRVNFLEPAFNKVFPEGWTYEPEWHLADDSVLSALPDMKGNSCSNFMDGHDLFSFNHRGVPMRFSHNVCKVKSGQDEDGDDEYKIVFDGQVYEATYKTRIAGYVRIVPTKRRLGHESTGDYMKLIKKQEVKVETDNIYFNEHFDVYATSEQDALFVLNPIVINYFCSCDQEGNHQALFVGGQSLVITRNGENFTVFKPPVGYKEIDALSVEGKCRDLTQIADACIQILESINGKNA